MTETSGLFFNACLLHLLWTLVLVLALFAVFVGNGDFPNIMRSLLPWLPVPQVRLELPLQQRVRDDFA